MSTPARRLPPRTAKVTQFQPDFVRKHSARVRSEHRRRSALALRVTLSAMSRKQASRVLLVDPSTLSRHTSGGHDSPLSRAREILRTLSRRGVSVAPIIADLLADSWSEMLNGLSLEDIRARRIEAHRREQAQQAVVDAWQLADMAGIGGDDEEIDEAILGQIGALVEILALRHEERNRRN